MRTTLLAILAAILLLPTAQAGFFARDPYVVAVGEHHAGTTVRWRVTDVFEYADRLVENESTIVVRIEDPSEDPSQHGWDGFLVRDAYGVLVKADVYRVDTLWNGEVVQAERCYALQQSGAAVRRDVLLPRPGASVSTGPVGSDSISMASARPVVESLPRSTFDGGSCLGREHLAHRRFGEGHILGLSEALPDLVNPRINDDIWSAPAERAEWNGREALVFRFDLARLYEGFANVTGTAVLTVALGGVVKAEFELETPGSAGPQRQRHVREMTGYVGGNGYIPPVVTRAIQAPARNPAATFVPFDYSAPLDDAALQLAYPYAEALAAIRADPTLGFKVYEERVGGAMLSFALYDRRMRDPSAPIAPTDGGWELWFVDPSGGGYQVQTVRLTTPSPASELGAPAKVARNHERVGAVGLGFAPFVPEVATGAGIASLVEAYGVAPGRIERLVYAVPPDEGGHARPALVVSDVSAEDADAENRGLTAYVDLARGGLYGLDETTARPGAAGLLPSFPSERNEIRPAAPPASGFSALVAPGVGENMAPFVAVTGLALLLLALKLLLLPLYTRLRRDRLLDNPVRARLYERVRAEPGLHRAELVDFAAIGEGATRHHLRQLVGARLLYETEQDGYVRYFAAGEVPPDVARREAVLRGGSARRVYDLLVAEPRLSLREAGARLGMSAPSVHRTKRKLEEAGLLPLSPR